MATLTAMWRAGRAPDLPGLYAVMCRITQVERAAEELWERGLVSGELHLGIGEEAVAAGVVGHLRDGDALSLDYRSTPPLVARGVDLEPLFLELMGDPGGLCGGRAGHMHLMSRPLRVAASGIVGAPGPLACGFGLAARRAGNRDIAVAFFGDGAVNEGMLMESLNLAAVWRLPVVFVCKDNGWAATTRTGRLIGGSLPARARGLGVPVRRVDGGDVAAVWRVAGRAVRRARRGRGPTFVLAAVRRPEGHFSGDPMLRSTPGARAAELRSLLSAATARGGGSVPDRLRALTAIGTSLATVSLDAARTRSLPLPRAAGQLDSEDAEAVEEKARAQVAAAVDAALRRAGVADRG